MRYNFFFISPAGEAGDWHCLPWWSALCSRPCRCSHCHLVPTGAWLGESLGAWTPVGADPVGSSFPSDWGDVQWRHLGARGMNQWKVINNPANKWRRNERVRITLFYKTLLKNRSRSWSSMADCVAKRETTGHCVSPDGRHTITYQIYLPKNIKPESNQASRSS